MAELTQSGWKIFMADTLIGVAYYRDVDFPWYVCDFKPTPAFEAYRPNFDQYAALVNDPASDEDIVNGYESKLASLILELPPWRPLSR